MLFVCWACLSLRQQGRFYQASQEWPGHPMPLTLPWLPHWHSNAVIYISSQCIRAPICPCPGNPTGSPNNKNLSSTLPYGTCIIMIIYNHYINVIVIMIYYSKPNVSLHILIILRAMLLALFVAKLCICIILAVWGY